MNTKSNLFITELVCLNANFIDRLIKDHVLNLYSISVLFNLVDFSSVLVLNTC